MAEEQLPQSETPIPEAAPDGIVPAERHAPAPAPVASNGVPSRPEPAEETTPKPPIKKRNPAPPKDTVREVAETVVFVIVLVLMLKTFIAEAFVIPTGSMASTLWGYQKVVDCPECGHHFPVNCSSESDPQSEIQPTPVVGCSCPNCRLNIDFTGVDEGPIRGILPDGTLLIESTTDRDPLLRVPYVVEQGVIRTASTSEVANGRFDFFGRDVQVGAADVSLNGRPYKAKITIDGKPDQKVENLQVGMVARVRFKLRERGPLPVLDIDAVTSGKPSQKFEYYNPAPNSGDRVLVAKFLYDSGLSPPNRHDVVVFKFPKEPQKGYVALNYIKRLIGKPGETIGIHGGNLYVTDKLTYPDLPDVRKPDLRLPSSMFIDDGDALKQLKADVRGGDEKSRVFTIIRKPPDAMLALSRIVFDNDHQAKDLLAAKLPTRWSGADPWKSEDADKRFTHEGGNDVAWLHYRNLVPSEDRTTVKPALVTNFMGYNSGQPSRSGSQAQDWVGDLMLECDIQADGAGEAWLEVSKGVDRFQARFDLSTGECKLVRLRGKLRGADSKKNGPGDVVETVLDTKPTKLKSGKYHVRFANYDERLTLWVDGDLPFGHGKEYDAPSEMGPTEENDLERPVSIGARGAKVQVEHLKIWRDTYYTVDQGGAADIGGVDASIWSTPSEWNRIRSLDRYKTLYVQPGHYLCMGDNSTQSSDGRDWGLVPDRLMLGRALVVYYPFKFTYWPLNNPVNRVGPIH